MKTSTMETQTMYPWQHQSGTVAMTTTNITLSSTEWYIDYAGDIHNLSIKAREMYKCHGYVETQTFRPRTVNETVKIPITWRISNGRPLWKAASVHGQFIDGYISFFHWISMVGHLVIRHVLMGDVSVMICSSGRSMICALASWYNTCNHKVMQTYNC